MSKDARNSLIAWGTVLALFGFMWLDSRYHLSNALPDLPDWTNLVPVVVLPLLILWEFVRAFRSRHERT